MTIFAVIYLWVGTAIALAAASRGTVTIPGMLVLTACWPVVLLAGVLRPRK